MNESPYASWDTDRAIDEFIHAEAELADRWVVACGGTEEPCLREGRWQLYVFNPRYRCHGWLDLSTDIVTTDGEVDAATASTILGTDAEATYQQ